MSQEYNKVVWQDETTSQQGTLINAERLDQMQTAHHYADGFEEVDTAPTADPGVDYHKVVYCTADSTIYRWDGTQWTADIDDPTRELLEEHEADHDNPHQVTKSQVGLGNADNTSDMDKPVSTATQTALNAKADKSDTYTKAQVDTALATKADKATTYTKTETDTLLGAKANDNAVVHLAGAETILGAKTFSDVITAEKFIRSKHKVLNASAIDTTLGRWVPIYTITRSGQSVPQASFYIALRKNGYAIIQVIIPPSGSLKIQGVLIGSARTPADLFRVSAEDSNTWTLWAYFATDDGIRADCLGAYGSNTQLDGSNITPLTGTKGYTITSEGYTDENSVVHTFTAYAEMENNLVHTSGDETIEGLKTFKGSSNISRLIYLQSANIETGVLPPTTRYETIEFVDKNTTPSTLNRLGEVGYLITNAGLSAVYLRAYKYDGSSYGQLALTVDASGNRYVTIPTRTYDPANTDDVATIGTLDAYTPMVRTTGNQDIAGVKNFLTPPRCNEVAWTSITGWRKLLHWSIGGTFHTVVVSLLDRERHNYGAFKISARNDQGSFIFNYGTNNGANHLIFTVKDGEAAIWCDLNRCTLNIVAAGIANQTGDITFTVDNTDSHAEPTLDDYTVVSKVSA